jgi:hypothetical protein
MSCDSIEFDQTRSLLCLTFAFLRFEVRILSANPFPCFSDDFTLQDCFINSIGQYKNRNMQGKTDRLQCDVRITLYRPVCMACRYNAYVYKDQVIAT